MFIKCVPICMWLCFDFYSVQMTKKNVPNKTLSKIPFIKSKLLYIYIDNYNKNDTFKYCNLKGIKDIYINGKRMKLLHKNPKGKLHSQIEYTHMYTSFIKENKKLWGYAWVTYFRNCPDIIYSDEI